MNVDFNELTAEFHLPCGHSLRYVYRVRVSSKSDDYNRQPEHFEEQLYAGTWALNAMLSSRAEMHQCELVTEDNPAGLPRKS